MNRLDGKCAIVTGANQGIGLACVERLIAEGARVLGSDVNPEIIETMNRVGATGLVTDVADRNQILAMVDTAVERLGQVDILVSNAGVVAGADFLDYPYEDFERVLKINLHSAFLGGQAVARHIVARGGTGSIVHISSVNAKLALLNQTAYVTSKGGLNQLTNVMALSLADKGIRVNGVGPGTIVTELTKARVLASEESRNRILSRTPMGRPGDVSEIASIVAFLASDDSSYVTGQTIYADGGRLGLNYTVPVAPD